MQPFQMKRQNTKYSQTLELHKILHMLADLTCCDDAADLARKIEPISELHAVQREIDKTQTAFSLTTRFGTPSFFRMKNPEADIKRAQAGGALDTSALLNIALVLRQARVLAEWEKQCEDVASLATDFDSLCPNRELERRITSAIIAEDEIDDEASEELSHIRRKMRSLELKAREHLDKMIRSPSYQKYLQDPVVTMRDGRFVVPVKAECKGNVQGLVHDTSGSGATLFIEPISVVEANNEIRVLQGKEQQEIDRILAELSALCGESGGEIFENFAVSVELNLYFAKANLAAKMRATAPHVTDSGQIWLRKARHPLIHPDKVVPIDIELGESFTSLVITGPNTGGKTVTLKTLGLLSLMVMCGLLIPVADNSTISVFDQVLVDIGDEQSIEQSLSTFSAHMTNIVSIISQADEKSLVLLDELGSGTDPVEGAAIAESILERLRQTGCRVAATTHYAELKIYALQTEGVENACCEFDVKTLQPTYRLLIGVPGRSNAFAISRRLGLPDDILGKAETLISNENKRFEDVVESLESARQAFEKKTEEVAFLNRSVSEQKKELEAQRKQMERRREAELEDAREKARRIVESVKAESQHLIDELETLRRQKDQAEFAKKVTAAKSRQKNAVSKLYDQANPVSQRENTVYQLPRPLKSGDTVLIFDIDKKGTVLSSVDGSGNVMVQAGIMKVRVPIGNLRLIENEKKVQYKGKTTRNVTSRAERTVTTEIDLRGKMVEEALMDLDAFIDHAVLSGVNIINIIHGKGTGALRKAVQQHLKTHQSIRSYRLGVYGEGEDGVTIAEIK